jgi:nuclear transport factor 2 (NTF2) superfamily protein
MENTNTIKKLLQPPFTMEIAIKKIQILESEWNTKKSELICLNYTINSEWRDKIEKFKGREKVKQFLNQIWENELEFKVKMDLWGFRNNRMAVCTESIWQDQNGQWFKSFGNELMEFDEFGIIQKRFLSSNDSMINLSIVGNKNSLKL